MKSGLYLSEFTVGGLKPPKSPEAAVAINRAGAELNGAKWQPGSHLTAPKPRERVEGALSEEHIPAIRLMHRNGTPVLVIAKEFAVGKGAIYDVINGKSWAHVPDEESAA